MKALYVSLPLLCLLVSCATSDVDNSASTSTSRYVAHDQAQRQGITGIESQDIVSMTDKMVRDMLTYPVFSTANSNAVVIVDDKYFTNDSNQRMNKKLIVDRLRTDLFRAAKGRIRFVARHASNMFEHEQNLRQDGVVGGTARTQTQAFYRLTGSFKNQAVNTGRAQLTNYVQVTFEMVDLQSNELVWTNMFEFKKAGFEETSVYK